MRLIRQFGIIATVTCVGELLRYFLPLPVPGSIYGLVLMLVLLVTGAVKLPQVKETADFLIEIMPLMFIPPGAGLLASWPQMQRILVPVVVICVSTTFIVMIVTGKVMDAVLAGKMKTGNAGTVGNGPAGNVGTVGNGPTGNADKDRKEGRTHE